MRFSEEEIERYARHLVLREIGGQGQQRLKAARVLMVGVGGLGSPAALYLAAAGVGRLDLVDFDVVSLSNLQRQVAFTAADVGRPKAQTAREALRALNPEIHVEALPERLDAQSAVERVAGYDLVLDGTDSFAARFALNDACLAAGPPLVSGALERWTGQVAVFGGRPCYRCLVPEAPPEAETCQTVGVVGALGGVIGSMMALEAIKLIVTAGRSLLGRLLIYDALGAETRTVKITADPSCPACGAPGGSPGGVKGV